MKNKGIKESDNKKELKEVNSSRTTKIIEDSINTSMFWTQKEWNLTEQLASDLNDVLTTTKHTKNTTNE